MKRELVLLSLIFVTSAVFAGRIDATVSADGSGDFNTIQEAIDAAPADGKKPFVIYIRNGEYDEKLFIEKNFITLVGEDRDSTVIKTAVLRRIWRESNDSDWGAATINIRSGVENLTLANLTVLNNFAEVYPDTPNPNDHTFAIRGGGHKVIIVNCNIIATGGDTLSLWNTSGGMYYHNDCYFEGYVDYVCPRGYCYITDCHFYGYNNNASIWHDGSGGVGHKLVIRSSEFDGVQDFALGRYHKDAAFYLLDCGFSERMRNLSIRFVGSASDYKLGKRVYYHNCLKEGDAYNWYTNNLETAKRAPHPNSVNADWTFYNLWNPEGAIDSLLPMAAIPSPHNGALSVSKAVSLSWVPGKDVAYHAVWMGPDTVSMIHLGDFNQHFTNELALSDTTAYCWRVDEISAKDTVIGKIWRFTTHLEEQPDQANSPYPADLAEIYEFSGLTWGFNYENTDSFRIYFGKDVDQMELASIQTNSEYLPETEAGNRYFWRVDTRNEYGETTGKTWSFVLNEPLSRVDESKETAALKQVFKSPQKYDWVIEYTLKHPGEISISLFDLSGRSLGIFGYGYKEKGTHQLSGYSIHRLAGDLPGGIYFCKLSSSGQDASLKLLIN